MQSMKRSLMALTSLFVLVGCEPPETMEDLPDDPTVMPDVPAPEFVDEGPDEPLIVQPGDVQWQDGPASLEEGAEFDRDTATALEPASHFSLPRGHPHYAEMEGETMIQLSSVGPWEIEYTNPEHDPRN